MSANPLAEQNIPYEEFSKWTPQQLTEYMNKLEVPVHDILIKQKISGELVPLLTNNDYEQLGFYTIGDMLKVKSAFTTFQRKARSAQRSIPLWEGQEYIMPSIFEQIFCCFKGCNSPDSYKVTSSSLSLKTKSPAYCCGCIGPIQGPLANCVRFIHGSQFSIDNVDLHLVTDVDSAGTSPDCTQRCCGIAGQDVVMVTSKMGGEETSKHQLYLRAGEGQKVVTLMRDAVEECRMSR